ncbi:hypothetical protein J2X06_002990 [Lysobacter niastensis]|uniref:Uncharacterized protein n=1 Tax=Lysobacter niastensis TaxID=380629 RepID=A0ABU1WDZ4_9GAMM|nr:hypothetical protein [Lysobacter niastensis]MDR7135772.1 hypothetical protein [Lysobacter niastensis]
MEIHRADRAYRNRTLWLLALIMLLCAVMLWQLNLWLRGVTEHLGGGDPETVRRWLRQMLVGLGLALAVPAIGLGLNLRRLGYAARLQGRFPPQEWKTLRDVRVLRDRTALDWARRVELLGLSALGLAGGLAGWALWAWWRYGG